MERSGFFDAVIDQNTQEPDRVYNAKQFAKYFSLFVGNGVFGTPTDQLQVMIESTISPFPQPPSTEFYVNPGHAFIDGWWYELDSKKIFQVQQNLSNQTRTDIVVCRWDNTFEQRKIEVLYLNGQTNPIRTLEIYDLVLARIEIPPGSVGIMQHYITDTRPMESICGFVTHILRIQTTESLFAQFESEFRNWFNNLQNKSDADIKEWFDKQQQEFEQYLNIIKQELDVDIQELFNQFNTSMNLLLNSFSNNFNSWFDEIRDTFELDDVDVAIHLQNQINELRNEFEMRVFTIYLPTNQWLEGGEYRFVQRQNVTGLVESLQTYSRGNFDNNETIRESQRGAIRFITQINALTDEIEFICEGVNNPPNIDLIVDIIQRKAFVRRFTKIINRNEWVGTGPYKQFVEMAGIEINRQAIVKVIFSENREIRDNERIQSRKVDNIEILNNGVELTCYSSVPNININIEIIMVSTI